MHAHGPHFSKIYIFQVVFSIQYIFFSIFVKNSMLLYKLAIKRYMATLYGQRTTRPTNSSDFSFFGENMGRMPSTFFAELPNRMQLNQIAKNG